jgi:hypothetical protein
MFEKEEEARVNQIISFLRMDLADFFVVHLRFRDHTELKTRPLRPNTEIGVLVIQEIALIKLSHRIYRC